MNTTQIDQIQQHKKQAVAHRAATIQAQQKPSLGFMDQRQETLQLQKLQHILNHSAQLQHMKALQKMAPQHSAAQQANTIQAKKAPHRGLNNPRQIAVVQPVFESFKGFYCLVEGQEDKGVTKLIPNDQFSDALYEITDRPAHWNYNPLYLGRNCYRKINPLLHSDTEEGNVKSVMGSGQVAVLGESLNLGSVISTLSELLKLLNVFNEQAIAWFGIGDFTISLGLMSAAVIQIKSGFKENDHSQKIAGLWNLGAALSTLASIRYGALTFGSWAGIAALACWTLAEALQVPSAQRAGTHAGGLLKAFGAFNIGLQKLVSLLVYANEPSVFSAIMGTIGMASAGLGAITAAVSHGPQALREFQTTKSPSSSADDIETGRPEPDESTPLLIRI